MADIFLSYASDDLKEIRPLVGALEQEGWSVFWDRDIPLGKTWRQVLDEQLSEARSVVVAWTDASVDRRWVIEEAEEGHARGILIPVFLDDVDAPRGFREVQGARLLKWHGNSEDPEFRRLCEACRKVIGEPATPPPTPSQPPPRPGTRAKWIAALVALALLGVGSWLGFRTIREPEETAETSLEEPTAEPASDPLIAALEHKEACDRGSAEDCKRLGDLYANGRGVGEDPLRAAGLYQRACTAKVASACVSLGAPYQEGRAVAKDEERASKLYERACEQGLEAGCERLELLKKRRLDRAKEAARKPTESSPVQRPAATTGAEKRAQLRVTVLPWGNVWVDGKHGRRAPLDVSLKPGTYTISVGQGSPSKSREVKLKPGERKTEHFDLSR